jgi:hypothetical protein
MTMTFFAKMSRETQQSNEIVSHEQGFDAITAIVVRAVVHENDLVVRDDGAQLLDRLRDERFNGISALAFERGNYGNERFGRHDVEYGDGLRNARQFSFDIIYAVDFRSEYADQARDFGRLAEEDRSTVVLLRTRHDGLDLEERFHVSDPRHRRQKTCGISHHVRKTGCVSVT